MELERVFKLRCAHQTFAWGKLGTSSLVAEFLTSSDEDMKIDPETPYSELWMGTHCLGPSRIIRSDGSEEGLAEWITKNPEAIRLVAGDNSDGDGYLGGLPFMFKFLSIQKTLSLQIHPDKSMAKTLHEQNPDVYKDGNHKPEMAIAINNFRALVGFKPIRKFAQHLSDIEELREIVGIENANKVKGAAEKSDPIKHMEALKRCFEEVFVKYSKKKYALLNQLVSRVEILAKAGYDITKYEGSNLLKIADEYPGDMGALAVYFLNEIILKPGHALFIPANEPHAYLEGDCLECMPCSHNVVRFGLTHKLKDSEQLVKMLHYESKQLEDILVDDVTYKENGCHYLQYLPPTKEFTITRIEIHPNKDTEAFTRVFNPPTVTTQHEIHPNKDTEAITHVFNASTVTAQTTTQHEIVYKKLMNAVIGMGVFLGIAIAILLILLAKKMKKGAEGKLDSLPLPSESSMQAETSFSSVLTARTPPTFSFSMYDNEEEEISSREDLTLPPHNYLTRYQKRIMAEQAPT